MNQPDPIAPRFPAEFDRRFCRHRGEAGLLLMDLMVALAILALVATSCVLGLLIANRQAAAYRALTSARAIVERNIETALNVAYTSTTTPPILATTPATGSVWDDDGNGDNLVTILDQDPNGTNLLLRGTLTRTVVAQSNPQNANILRVTFSLTFSLRGHNYTSAMTTFRAIDDF